MNSGIDSQSNIREQLFLTTGIKQSTAVAGQQLDEWGFVSQRSREFLLRPSCQIVVKPYDISSLQGLQKCCQGRIYPPPLGRPKFRPWSELSLPRNLDHGLSFSFPWQNLKYRVWRGLSFGLSFAWTKVWVSSREVRSTGVGVDPGALRSAAVKFSPENRAWKSPWKMPRNFWWTLLLLFAQETQLESAWNFSRRISGHFSPLASQLQMSNFMAFFHSADVCLWDIRVLGPHSRQFCRMLRASAHWCFRSAMPKFRKI